MLTCPTAGSFVIVVAIAIAVVGLVHKMKKVTNRMIVPRALHSSALRVKKFCTAGRAGCFFCFLFLVLAIVCV